MTWSCIIDTGETALSCVVCSTLPDEAATGDDWGGEGAGFLGELVVLQLPPVTHRTQSIPWIGWPSEWVDRIE